jgi:hypothetical protein
MSDRICDPTRLLMKRSLTTSIGYDYGIPAYALLAVDTAFVNLLYEAEIVGCAYGLMPFPGSDVPMRIFSLVAQNADPARRAFEVFKQWADSVDADCVQLNIVLLSSGGYLLAIGPEPDRSAVRLAGYGSLLQPITMAATYVKRLDTVSAGVFDLREYKKLPISPVMFTAAVTSAREPTANMNLGPIDGCPELIKFEFEFIEESAARQDPLMSALIDGVDKPIAKPDRDSSARKRLAPERIAEQRTKAIKQRFPVTLHRIHITPALQSLKSKLTSQGIRDWQVDQAICNLQISEHCHKYLLVNTDREDGDAPLAVLSSRFEDVTTTFRSVGLREVEEQLLADARYLIQGADPHLEPAATLYECAGQLAHLGVLNG